MEKEKIHFIGICGVAMSALALALKKAGHEITGSDKGVYPPISTYLKKSGINYYVGWHPELMTKNGNPDLVVVGNVAGSTNPEWLYVQNNNIPYKSYPEIMADFFIKKNSIVCAGTYGKTSTTTLLAWILKNADMDPSYMFGGLSQNNIPAANIGDSDWSVVEGDEYKSSRWDNGAKFFHYKPTHLLLTSVKWDHADVYPTKKNYFEAFEKLIKTLPENALMVVSENISPAIINKVQKKVHCHSRESGNPGASTSQPLDPRFRGDDNNIDGPETIIYGQSENCDYQYDDINQTTKGLNFNISYENQIYNIKTKVLGTYMAENICGAFAMAHQIGIQPELIVKSLDQFTGIKRRLEKRGQVKTRAIVYDDIAHSPDKVKSILKTLKEVYTGKLIAIFEPNTGNRKQEATPAYHNAFELADEVIIPRLTLLKADPKNPSFDGLELKNIISKTHNQTKYIDDDEKLIEHLEKNTKKEDTVVFLGSHGFRGMIDELINHPLPPPS